MTTMVKQLLALREVLMNSMSIDRELRLKLLIEIEKELEKQLKTEQGL